MTTAALQQARPIWLADAGRALHAHRWLIGYTLAYMLCGLALAKAARLPEQMSLSLYSGASLKILLGCVGAFVLLYPLYVMLWLRPERLIETIVTDFRTRYLTPDRLLGALIVMALLPLFVSVFTGIKALVPVLVSLAAAVVSALSPGRLHHSMACSTSLASAKWWATTSGCACATSGMRSVSVCATWRWYSCRLLSSSD